MCSQMRRNRRMLPEMSVNVIANSMSPTSPCLQIVLMSTCIRTCRWNIVGPVPPRLYSTRKDIGERTLCDSSVICRGLPNQDFFVSSGDDSGRRIEFKGSFGQHSNKLSIVLGVHFLGTYCGLSSSCMSLSFSLKQPSEQMAFSTSVSTADAFGMTCVCTTSIMGSSSSSSPLPPAVTHGCLLISASYQERKSFRKTGFTDATLPRLPTVSRFSGLTSIMPFSKLWQSGGTNTDSLSFSRLMILMATFFPSTQCTPSFTRPVWPFPSVRSSRYGPTYWWPSVVAVLGVAFSFCTSRLIVGWNAARSSPHSPLPLLLLRPLLSEPVSHYQDQRPGFTTTTTTTTTARNLPTHSTVRTNTRTDTRTHAGSVTYA
uniref:Uncharacterized protein n=1 Tax=Anopheles atroparvus TaxID=41427 RepID=A0A182IJH7_ANOAO